MKENLLYDYLDRPVAALAADDAFLVAAMRRWVAAARGGRCAGAALQGGFRQHGVAAAMADFAIAMATLDRDGVARLRFAPVAAPLVTDDEARLLALFATARGDRAGAVGRAATGLVESAAVSRLDTAVRFVGAAMTGEAA